MPFYRDEQNRLIRKDGSLVEGAQQGRAKGPRRTELGGGRVSHLKVDKILGGAGPLRDEYEALLENPNTLLKDLQAWFAARGLYVNKTAINVHRHRFLAVYERVREASRLAAGLNEVVRRSGNPAVFSEAAQAHFEMKLMQKFAELKDEPDVSPDVWQSYVKTLGGMVQSRRHIEGLRDAYERKAAEAARAGEDAAKKGATGKDVVARMREILGV